MASLEKKKREKESNFSRVGPPVCEYIGVYGLCWVYTVCVSVCLCVASGISCSCEKSYALVAGNSFLIWLFSQKYLSQN